MLHQILIARMSDADSYAAILVADMGADRTQAIMARGAAADLHPQLAGRKIDLGVEHQGVVRRALVEAHRFRDRATRFVHVGSGLEQQ